MQPGAASGSQVQQAVARGSDGDDHEGFTNDVPNGRRLRMKIYTRTGDNGSTGLFGGSRVSKDDIRIEGYGTVDELNAAIGVVRASDPPPGVDQQLERIQSELFSIGAELATPDPESRGLRIIGQSHIERLEQWIDLHEEGLPSLTHFILPAGTPSSSQLHLARGICRRAERRVVTLSNLHPGEVSESIVVYLNRLSDLLFVLSRVANYSAGVPEVEWTRP